MTEKHEATEMAAFVPETIWKDFKRVMLHLHPEYSDNDIRQSAAFAMVGALTDFTLRIERSWPYQTLPARGGGWLVCYCEEDKEPRVTDSHPEPFPEKQKSNADRLRKSLNRKWHKADKDTEAIIAEKGGLVL